MFQSQKPLKQYLDQPLCTTFVRLLIEPLSAARPVAMHLKRPSAGILIPNRSLGLPTSILCLQDIAIHVYFGTNYLPYYTKPIDLK